jgi:hypothetical protein
MTPPEGAVDHPGRKLFTLWKDLRPMPASRSPTIPFSARRPTCSPLVPGGDALERLSATDALALACGDVRLVLGERAHALAA